MAYEDDEPAALEPDDTGRNVASDPEPAVFMPKRRRWPFVLAAIGILLLVALGYGWFARERIVGDLIGSELGKLGLPATYEIESIGTDRQIIRNIVVGDPDNPDLTVKRAIVHTRIVWGTPEIGRIALDRPRLFGAARSGRVSFGSLDPLIYTGSKAPFRLPDLDLAIRDGRALIESPHGAIGMKIEGAGALRDGFSGLVAVAAPSLQFADCSLSGVSLYGTVAIDSERPRFKGPARIARASCAAVRAGRSALAVDATFDPALDGAEGTATLDAASLAMAETRIGSGTGDVRFTWRNDAVTARYGLDARRIGTPLANAASLTLDGVVRTSGGFNRIEVDSDVAATSLSPGAGTFAVLEDIARSGSGTLIEPVVRKIAQGLAVETRASALTGHGVFRQDGGRTSLVITSASLRSARGDTVLALSRVQVLRAGGATPRITGNFSTGGRGLPRIAGRMEQRPGTARALRIRMAEYVADDARIAIPQITLVQSAGGSLGFAGSVRLSGTVPGGRADNLVLPLDGNWSSRGGLALWRGCTRFAFDRLTLANLQIGRRALTACPARGSAILRAGAGGLRIAGGFDRLDLAGTLAGTPIRIASGAVGFAYPGVMTARRVDVALGPAPRASRFAVTQLDARLGKDISGSFAGADIFLNAVPLDILRTQGEWSYRNDVLSIDNAAFTLEDREAVDRFQPLVARGASLTLADNAIVADATLREPESDREVLRTHIRHDLATGRGDADLLVDGVLFDERLQPDTLTRLALGVVANARGVLRGKGRIAWDENAVTSTGTFTTDALDFAAAFGPVTGLSGSVEFADLLGLVTAPDQRLRVDTVNPGIEVTDGVVDFALNPGYRLAIAGVQWPFMGGTLTLEPVTMTIGSDETLRYVLVIRGLDAARFVQRLELANLNATGIFDGQMPLVFDKDGGRIDGGRLSSRPPGGNVSYVGELTYKDLSPIANFAFDALKSLDYEQMDIAMDGALEGELVTRVTFDGVSQGEGAASNFITRRISRLPLRFRVNIRAPFMQLVTSVRAMYDPAYIRDPRTLGLIDAQGNPIDPAAPGAQVSSDPAALPPRSDPIQPSESDETL